MAPKEVSFSDGLEYYCKSIFLSHFHVVILVSKKIEDTHGKEAYQFSGLAC